ncbi:hypothetical protein Micbo1qcDRAFT_68104 [Microdochium bolleyi]|uniref:Uncharacterized protein n=1 Tax=Microdochium bolleyi TaxID=196109 RepID=A0A136J161_9PEZI|nr:hypothetical protein Micbo1qcDRAFT_68104 [Microdochium bolleyi]
MIILLQHVVIMSPAASSPREPPHGLRAGLAQAHSTRSICALDVHILRSQRGRPVAHDHNIPPILTLPSARSSFFPSSVLFFPLGIDIVQPNFFVPPVLLFAPSLPFSSLAFLPLPIISRWPARSPSSFSVRAVSPPAYFFCSLSALVVRLDLATLAPRRCCGLFRPPAVADTAGRTEAFLIAPWAIVLVRVFIGGDCDKLRVCWAGARMLTSLRYCDDENCGNCRRTSAVSSRLLTAGK